MRILGKDGYVSVNAVVDPEYLNEAEGYGNTMIGSLHFYDGYAYSDFDPKTDRVSEWTIGGLVAGSILAKTGLLAKIGIFLLKFWKLAVLAFFGIVAAIAKLFKRKKDEPQVADPAVVCKKFEENGNSHEDKDHSYIHRIPSEGCFAAKIKFRSETDALCFFDNMDDIYFRIITKNRNVIELQKSDNIENSRFEGRWMGYIMAFVCDRMKEELHQAQQVMDFPRFERIACVIFKVFHVLLFIPEKMTSYDGKDSQDNPLELKTINAKMTEEERVAIKELEAKINERFTTNIVDLIINQRTKGVLEGILIYINHLTPQTLTKNVVIQLAE